MIMSKRIAAVLLLYISCVDADAFCTAPSNVRCRIPSSLLVEIVSMHHITLLLCNYASLLPLSLIHVHLWFSAAYQ
jgi:poly-beta-hydroxyalkanoate depolymerase